MYKPRELQSALARRVFDISGSVYTLIGHILCEIIEGELFSDDHVS
jgi:hypothetical protein